MKIVLIGYGRMGREIERIALERGHSVPMIIDEGNAGDLVRLNREVCDVAVEFTVPESAVGNYLACFDAGVPVVSGTTGWLHRREEVLACCRERGGTFFYASNFSVGVNLFFEMNRRLATLMAQRPEYQPSIREIHHAGKKDAPSGTAISLAEDLVGILPGKTGWVNHPDPGVGELVITSDRTGLVAGIHTVTWDSDDDFLEITHHAKSRRGFALGAVMAVEFCRDHHGILTMRDMLNL